MQPDISSDRIDFLIRQCSHFQVEISNEEASVLLSYMDLTLEKNQVLNLTSIINEEEFIYKHLLDSLILIGYWEKEWRTCLDIGTGGGFPLVPLSILKPFVRFVGMDSVAKKLKFIEEASRTLHLSNVDVVHGRFEDLGILSAYRESFDCVVSRAVAELRVLLEYSSPFVKPGGIFVAYKSLLTDAELSDSKTAVKELGFELLKTIRYDLGAYGSRTLLFFKKVRKLSSKYPRRVGVAKKSPL